MRAFSRWAWAVAGAFGALATLAVAAEPSRGGAPAWSDPYPPAPARNDRKFVGEKWLRGPKIGGRTLEYLARVPKGDTAALPLIVVGAAGEESLAAHPELYRNAVVLYIGPTSADVGAAHNAWLLEEMSAGDGPECSPACPSWMFVPAAALRDVLEDFARHVRFAHDRAQMFVTNDARYGVYRALDPLLQPYFAGLAYGIYAEWQQASCPGAAPRSAAPPRIFFSFGGCDESFCPTMECMSALRGLGYEIDAASAGDTSAAACPCPGGDRPHLLPAGAGTRAATYRWLLSNARK